MDNRVVIDSDFCNMIVPGNNKEREKDFFRTIFESLNKSPVIHAFVFNQELLTNTAIKELVKEQFIEVIDYDAFLPDDIFKTQYTDTFVDFYKFMNGESIDNSFATIIQHHAHKNMGEIHSLILAHYMNIPVFMSNDNGAKELARSKINTQAFTITVKNVCEVFCDIKKMGSIQIERKTVKAILKQRKNWLEFYDNQ